MIHLLRLELTKMKRSRYSLGLLLLLLIAVGSYFFYTNQKEMGLKEAELLILSNLEFNQDFYEQTKSEIETKGGTINFELQNSLEVAERQYKAYQMMHEGIINKDWSLYLQGEIMNTSWYEEAKKKELETVVKSYLYTTPFTVFTGIDQLRWMEERDIQPLFPSGSYSWLSLYDEEFDDPMVEKFAYENAEKYSASGFYFIYQAFGYGFGLVGLLFILFLFTDILTKEGFGRNGPIQMLRTQPIRRTIFWVSKGVTVIVGSLLVILLVALAGLGLGSLFNRLGDWDYPILIYGPERTYSFLTIAEFLGKGLGLFLLVLALGFSFLFLFSVLTNRAVLAIGLTVAVLFIGQMLTEQSLLLTWSHWLPFHYINVYPILNGEYAVVNENTLFTYRQAILSLSVSTLILLLTTFGAVKLRKGVMS